ncbi:MAG: class IV adenylate cyclase [bacterium]|nr:class IV adenylate cyclase [bacterium]
MAKEIEVKFKVANFGMVRRKLKSAGAKRLGQAFEKTTKFDAPNEALRQRKLWLRTRSGFKNVITLKEKTGAADKKFKERRETEIEISDVGGMEEILKRLGFSKTLVMEKVREKWFLGKTEVVLDKLPFGNFLEIEGLPKAIEKTEKTLGLNPAQRIVLTYWHLWEDIRKKKGIENENIVFKS